MPDQRRHRGAHPEDRVLFAPARLPMIREAVCDLSWLLGRGYTELSALKLVGDRYGLRVRQRHAVARAACSEAQRARRQRHRCTAETLTGQTLAVDGFNVLITVESWLSGGLLVLGHDGALRDLASVHGSYRDVEETEEALGLIARAVAQLRPERTLIYFDRPVSNSGRVAALTRHLFERIGLEASVECVPDPDQAVVSESACAASADAWVLDRAEWWIDLPRRLIEACPSRQAWLLDTSLNDPRTPP